jgi:hypothetical protein
VASPSRPRGDLRAQALDRRQHHRRQRIAGGADVGALGVDPRHLVARLLLRQLLALEAVVQFGLLLRQPLQAGALLLAQQFEFTVERLDLAAQRHEALRELVGVLRRRSRGQQGGQRKGQGGAPGADRADCGHGASPRGNCDAARRR